MRLILDEDLPRGLTAAFSLAGHDAAHVEALGWKGIRNGDLLSRVSGRFDALITGDTNMRFQQDLLRFDVAVMILHPQKKTLAQLLDLVPRALAALADAPKGDATIIEPI